MISISRGRTRTRTLVGMSTVALVAATTGMAIAAAPRATAASCTRSWTGSTSGAWDDGLRWSPKGVPNGLDETCITNVGKYSVTVPPDLDVSITDLTLGAPSGTQTLVLGEACAASGELGMVLSGAGIDIGVRGVLDAPAAGCPAVIAHTNGGFGTITDRGQIRVHGTLEVDGHDIAQNKLLIIDEGGQLQQGLGARLTETPNAQTQVTIGPSFTTPLVADDAVLGGTLKIVTAPGFTPAAGSSFVVVSASTLETGFPKYKGVAIGSGGLYYQPVYDVVSTPQTLTLVVAQATIDAAPTSGPPGTVVTLTGAGFRAGKRIDLKLRVGKKTRALTHLDAAADGSISTTITIPAGTAPGAAAILAIDKQLGLTVSTPFVVS